MSDKNSIKTHTYLWKGINPQGLLSQGSIESMSLRLAKAELQRRGIHLTAITQKSFLTFDTLLKRKITQQQLTGFSRQLATLLIAGIPLVQSLEILAITLDNAPLQILVQNIKAAVESGLSFSDSLAKYPKQFSSLFCHLVYIGEQSGTLETMLARIANYQEKMQSLRAKIKKALFYPMTVLIIAGLSTFIMLSFIIPQFESLFNQFGADLPFLTRLVIRLASGCQHYIWAVLAVSTISLISVIQAQRHSPTVKYLLERAILGLPILGKIVHKTIIARFARTLAISFSAGLALIDALQNVAPATASQIYAEALIQARHQVMSGQRLQVALKNTKLFPHFVIQMVAVGEETGSLETMLSKIADFYEEEVDNAIGSLSSLIEPIIMLVLGSVVGMLVIAMYLPLFKLGGIV